MKEIRKAMVTVLLIVLCTVNLTAADPVMSVSPSQQPTDIAINDTFTVDVTVDPMGDEVYAAQYDLFFDAGILSAAAPTQGDFLSQDGDTTLVFMNTIDNTIGKIIYCETRTGENGVTTPGTLSSITFTVIGDGISDLTLSNVECVMTNDLNEPEPEPTDEGSDKEPSDTEESNNHKSSGSSNFAAAPAATTALTATLTPTTESPTATDDDTDSTPPTAGAGVIPTTESTSAVTPTKADAPNAPSQSGFKTPGFGAASLIVVLLYLIKRRGE